jgi:hypothetical protein
VPPVAVNVLHRKERVRSLTGAASGRPSFI